MLIQISPNEAPWSIGNSLNSDLTSRANRSEVTTTSQSV